MEEARRTEGEKPDLTVERGMGASTSPPLPFSASSHFLPWRSLDELAGAAEVTERLAREFPEGAERWSELASRRDFLKLSGASLLLAGMAGCARQPEEKIIPYARKPENLTPGKPLYFATAATLGGYAIGVLAESHMGRPTKIEGNPEHPASLGATDAFAQASVLCLYDPDRSQVVLERGQISAWSAFVDALTRKLAELAPVGGRGLRILTETVTSPSLAAQLDALLARYPEAQWQQYEPVNRDNERAGARAAFGEDADAIYDFRRANVVLSLDADFLTDGPGRLQYTRDFVGRRDPEPVRPNAPIEVGAEQAPAADFPGMNRLYVVETTPTLTGAFADHVVRVRSQDVAAIARALARRLGVDAGPESWGPPTSVAEEWLDAIADDLRDSRASDGRSGSLVLAGRSQPPEVHALAHAINNALGSVGSTVTYVEPIEMRPVLQLDDLRALVDDVRAGRVEALVILGGNPAFSAPADFEFSKALAAVPFGVHLSLYEDETSALCNWHVPAAHDLETWSDARACDGTATILQPLIAPLYGGKSAGELLALMAGSLVSAYDAVKEHWRTRAGGDRFEEFWQRAVHDGVIPDTQSPEKVVTLQSDFGLRAAGYASEPSAPDDTRFELVLRPDPTIWDGRFANNSWLQELPKPLTKLTWDNAALISPADAERLDLSNGDVVSLSRGDAAIELPVWILPGQPERSVTVHFGYGRDRGGGVAVKAGVDTYPLRTSHGQWFGSVDLSPTGRRALLAGTQTHFAMDGRDLARSGTLEEYQHDPAHFASGESHEDRESISLYPEYEYSGYKWGMSIDLGKCIGCSACVVACQAENNIPTVGKTQVAMSREMHWLRIDTYHEGPADRPQTHHQPVLCMHCELAPCEPVCPVAATTHSSEGLNEMTYNRCVGTRYCSNNCPYKVRRFNFLEYDADKRELPILQMLPNPDVTVRSRGVMEKCTYCVQRISAARIDAENELRTIRDGEVVTACQAACPAQAIVFGDLNDPQSRVTQQKGSPRDYALLGELNTRPRTTYLAAVRNPNPKLSGG